MKPLITIILLIGYCSLFISKVISDIKYFIKESKQRNCVKKNKEAE